MSRKYVERDPALERRFQPIIVSEPSVEEYHSYFKGTCEINMKHHRVKITDDAIKAAAVLSSRYIADGFCRIKQ